MALSPWSSSVGLRKAFSNLLASRHLNNFTSLHTEVSTEYLIQNIADEDDCGSPPKKHYSAPGESRKLIILSENVLIALNSLFK